ncbi:hypothetical protein [Microseira sp. BLCC-F43]|jgi:hypothetical protein|uniref:hypothetical protein n=1 Tax=Microseira sp. BLCC-F43 TaxID=3153602 RepID=UPI0035B7AF70
MEASDAFESTRHSSSGTRESRNRPDKGDWGEWGDFEAEGDMKAIFSSSSSSSPSLASGKML